MLIEFQRNAITALLLCVKGSTSNGNMIFELLPQLRTCLGPLKIPSTDSTGGPPFPFAMRAQLVSWPRMHAEEVIIECLRNNEYLCAEQLPKNLFMEFGELLNNEPDPSTSPLLEFFVVALLPEGEEGNALAHNQASRRAAPRPTTRTTTHRHHTCARITNSTHSTHSTHRTPLTTRSTPSRCCSRPTFSRFSAPFGE